MLENDDTVAMLDRAVVGRAEVLVGRRLCRDEAEAVALEVFDECGDDCPDRVLSEVAAALFGRMTPVPCVAHTVSRDVEGIAKEEGRLRRLGMCEGRHFKFGKVASLEVLFWRLGEDAARDVLQEDDTAMPMLGRAMCPFMPFVDGMDRGGMLDIMAAAVSNTMPLTSGARILRKAAGLGEEPLQRYLLNLFLLRDDLERKARERKGWGNDFAINRVNPDQMPVQYLSFQDLAPLYPNSDIERPIDNMRQQEEKNNQEDGRRRPKKYKRRLGDER